MGMIAIVVVGTPMYSEVKDRLKDVKVKGKHELSTVFFKIRPRCSRFKRKFFT